MRPHFNEQQIRRDWFVSWLPVATLVLGLGLIAGLLLGFCGGVELERWRPKTLREIQQMLNQQPYEYEFPAPKVRRVPI